MPPVPEYLTNKAEKMTIDEAMRLLDCAYNDITFKNAILCVLDWINWYHCTHVHKDTAIGVDRDGVRIEVYKQVSYSDRYVETQDTVVNLSKQYFRYVASTDEYVSVAPEEGDNPSEKGWYEYANPQANNWYEKRKTKVSYSPIDTNKITYYDLPHANNWYEKDAYDVYYISEDEHATGTFVDIANPGSGVSPRANDWYEKVSSNPDVYQPSNDNNVIASKQYAFCVYKQYYKQITESVKEYFHTEDTIVITGKTYYKEKNPDHYLPEDPEAWDYTDHYERNISIDVPGIDSEITLVGKRPCTI